MKPQKFLPLLIILAAVSLALCFTLRKNPNAPRYVPAISQPAVIPGQILYNYLGAAPFANGAFWIYTGIGTTNVQTFLFDLDQRKIIGELLNCQPGICNRDRTKLLYTEISRPFKASLSAILAKISRGRLNLGVKAIQSTSILNLTNNHVHRLESHEMSGNFAGLWFPFPDSKFSYSLDAFNFGSATLAICDLQAETYETTNLPCETIGSWGDHQLLVRDPAGDLQLYDVQTKKISSLLTHEAITHRLRELQLTNTLADLRFFPVWNGTNLDYFLNCTPPIRQGEKGFLLLKLSHANSTITPFDHFDPWIGGEFDPSQTHYLYVSPAPAPKNPNDGAIYLADLLHNTTTTLFPPLTRDEGTYPRFYGTNLIYVSSNQLWMTTLDAKTQTRLYPPPENK